MPDVTKMVVKVDLKCKKCKKKIKKVLCKIPQIENQVYDEKNNAVTITVVCCSPEKVKKKILCKGGDIIIGIEILKPPEKPIPVNPKQTESNPKLQQPKHQQPSPAPPPTEQVQAPQRDCCKECSEGYWGGPCYQGHVRPPLSCYYSYYGCYGRPVCDCWGSGCRRCYVICEEYPTSCTIM